jgi:hypothetical protein
MSEEYINLELSQQQLATIISGLLFSCSVNVVSNTNEEYQRELFEIAKRLKDINPIIELKEIQFVEEKNYEDSLSQEILAEFGDNMDVVTFQQV